MLIILNPIKNYAIRVINSKINRSGLDIWTGSAVHTEELLKILFAESLCKYQDKDSLEKTTALFKTIRPAYFFSSGGDNVYEFIIISVKPNFSFIINI